MTITAFVIIAILIEGVWETSKMIWQDGKISFDKMGSLLVSVLVCLAVNVDILKLLNFESSIPYLGIVLTGVLVSRGSNYIHDLLNLIEKISKT